MPSGRLLAGIIHLPRHRPDLPGLLEPAQIAERASPAFMGLHQRMHLARARGQPLFHSNPLLHPMAARLPAILLHHHHRAPVSQRSSIRLRRRAGAARDPLLHLAPRAAPPQDLRADPQAASQVRGAHGICRAVRAPRGARPGQHDAHRAPADADACAYSHLCAVPDLAAGRDGERA